MNVSVARLRRGLVSAAILVAPFACLPRRGPAAAPAPVASASESASVFALTFASSSIVPSASASASSVASASSAAPSSSVISSRALPLLPDVADAPVPNARVTFVSAVLGPGRVGGAQWERIGIVPEEVWKETSSALRADDPYGAVMRFITSGGYAGLSKPALKGRVSLLGPTGDKLLDLPKVEDSFTPRWTGIEFRHVPLEKRTRLRIEFIDVNATADASIGVAELDGAALIKIDGAGKVVAWPFADQTANQVLFVMVSVVPE